MLISIRIVWLLVTVIAALAFLFLAPPIHQDQRYHLFADQRTILGIANFWNVVSNLPFAVVGILGLRAFRDGVSRLMFAGVLLTAFGSAYYHYRPDDATLVWDRLPMTLVFMPLLAIVLDRWIGPVSNTRGNQYRLAGLVLFGIGSVFWWQATDDLRPYVIAQFGPVLVLIPAFITDKRIRALWPVVAWYALAKVAETFDNQIYSALGLSGHTLKHLAGAAATFWIFRWRTADPKIAMPVADTMSY